MSHPPHPPSPRLFLSAGEASGDHYGAAIIHGLKAALPGAHFTGLGGRAMRDAGQQQVVRAEDVAVMGITEILRHVPAIVRSYRRLVRSIRAHRPDAAVLIDFPDVNFRLARYLHRAGVPVVWFVSPQLWAWKRRRLRWVQQRVSRMLVIFPFEEPFYRSRGVNARFVGHPLAELPPPSADRASFAAAHALRPDAVWIALLPGSRARELAANLPEILRAASLLTARDSDRFHFLLPVASTLSPETVQAAIDQATRALPPGQPPRLTLVPDARDALHHARASVVASGTATVQAAIIGNPFLVVYRVSALTFSLARRLVRYPPELPATPDAAGNLPVAMVNLIAGRRAVPELLNRDFTAERIVAELTPLLAAGPARDAQMAALAQVRRALQPPAGVSSTATVVQEIVALLKPDAAPAPRPFTTLPRLK